MVALGLYMVGIPHKAWCKMVQNEWLGTKVVLLDSTTPLWLSSSLTTGTDVPSGLQ